MAKRAQRAAEVVPEEVSRLLEERTEVQGWLEKLTELREEAIPEVYAKVEADYRTRLEGVNERLLSHRSELETSLGAREERVETLQAERNERAGELEEARLRHFVGEYDDAAWEELREVGETAVRGLDGHLEEERAALDSIRTTLAALSEADAEGSEDARPAVAGNEERPAVAGNEEEQEADEAVIAEAPTATEEEPAADTPEKPDGDFLDELEFLESLSLEDTDRFDAVSAMLEGEEETEKEEERA